MRNGDSGSGAGRERGQAELVGFALVFGFVLLAFVVVLGAIYPQLADVREYERTQAVERGFESLAGNVEDVARGGAPSRSTRVRVAGGQIGFGDPVTIRVEGTPAFPNKTISTRPLVYRSGEGTAVTYAAGAVLRSDRDGSGTSHAMLRSPRMLLTEERVVLPVVEVRRTDHRTVGIGGSSVVAVETVRNGTEVLAADDTTDNLTITITSARAAAWHRTLDQSGADCSLSEVTDTTTCTIETDRVYVVRVRVDVWLHS